MKSEEERTEIRQPRILITASCEEIAQRLKGTLAAKDIIAATKSEMGDNLANGSERFDLVVELYAVNAHATSRLPKFRSMLVSQPANVQTDGLYDIDNIGELGAKLETALSGLRSQGRRPPPLHPNAQVDRTHDRGQVALAKIVGRSPAIKKVKELIRRVSRFPNVPVLITGETGTGKELVADALHTCSSRADQPIIKVNCGAIPDGLFESQFFGHRKGAFSGANYSQIGFVAAAHEGVLFLDEISSLRFEHQAKLLRFLQNGDYVPVGETAACKSNAWIIAASNQNLVELAFNSLFRLDLCQRLNALEISVPPLRKRQDDILFLARHFMKAFAENFGKVSPKLSEDVQYILSNYPWAGNVRELESLMRAILIKRSGRLILPEHLEGELDLDSLKIAKGSLCDKKIRPLQEIEKTHILMAFKATGYQVRKTAQLLKISRNTLKKKLTDCGVETNV